MRRLMACHAEAAGLDWVPTPSSVRHLHASILNASGIHAEALAQWLEPGDSHTMAQRYIQLTMPVVEVGADLNLRS